MQIALLQRRIRLLVLSVLLTLSLGVSAKSFEGFSHVIFEISNARGGRGDVAASYLSILELIKVKKFQNQITVVADEKCEKILRGLMQGSSDGRLFNSRVQVVRLGKIPDSLPPADAVIRFAEADGRIRSPNRFYSEGPHDPDRIRIHKTGLIVSQPVIGNTESRTPHGTIRMNGQDFRMQHPGLRRGDGGVYLDPTAVEFRDMQRPQIVREIVTDVKNNKHAGTARAVTNILEGRSLANAEMALVYGISSDQTTSQFVRYLNGFSGADKPIVLLTPSRVNIGDIARDPDLKVKVKYIKAGSRIPMSGNPNTVYIVETKGLSHRTFTGLLAASQRTPLIAGDGAMSGAITLGRPFVMTKVPHNVENINRYRARLLSETQDPDARQRILKLFDPKSPALELAQNLSEPEARAFKVVGQRTPSVLTSVISASNHVLGGEQTIIPLISRPVDPRLESDVRYNRALNDPKFVEGDPGFQEDLKSLKKCLLRGYCLTHELPSANRAAAFQQGQQLFDEARIKIVDRGESAVDKLVRVLDQITDPRAQNAIQLQKVAAYNEIAKNQPALLSRWLGKEALSHLNPKDPATVKIFHELLAKPWNKVQLDQISLSLSRLSPADARPLWDLVKEKGLLQNQVAIANQFDLSPADRAQLGKSILESGEFAEDLKKRRGGWWIRHLSGHAGPVIDNDSASLIIKTVAGADQPELLKKLGQESWFKEAPVEMQRRAILSASAWEEQLAIAQHMQLSEDKAARLFSHFKSLALGSAEVGADAIMSQFVNATVTGQALDIPPSQIAELADAMAQKLPDGPEGQTSRDRMSRIVRNYSNTVENRLMKKLKGADLCL